MGNSFIIIQFKFHIIYKPCFTASNINLKKDKFALGKDMSAIELTWLEFILLTFKNWKYLYSFWFKILVFYKCVIDTRCCVF